MTELAFTQLCGAVGLPAAYIKKCFDTGRSGLALQNYFSWADENGSRGRRKGYLVRSYKDVIQGIVTPGYNTFDSDEILDALAETLDGPKFRDRFSLNQAYLSPARLHMRFVDFTDPAYTEDGGDKLYKGFTISSSSVGAGSFNLKFFLYRYACMNGLVIIRSGGVIYRQTHLSSFEETKKYEIAAALDKVDEMSAIAVPFLAKAENKHLTLDEMNTILNRARKELHMGRETSDEMKDLNMLLNVTYPQQTVLSIANAITENAQRYTSLDKRIEHETWAGNLLMAA